MKRQREREEEEADSSQCLRSRATIVPAGSKKGGGAGLRWLGRRWCHEAKAPVVQNRQIADPGRQILVIGGAKKQEADFPTQTSLQRPVITQRPPPPSPQNGVKATPKGRVLRVPPVPPISSCHPLLPPWPADSPDAQSSSSAPFSQSFSPSHRHDNDTHLLLDPPQLNFSGGHVCTPAGSGIKEIISSAFNGRGHKKKHLWSSAGADFPRAPTHLILHHSSQLISPSQRHTERS